MIRSTPTLANSAGKATALLLAAAMVASTAPVLPYGWEAATVLSGPRDESAIASYQLRSLTPGDYTAAIKTALAKGDADMADSLRTLALKQAVQLPDALVGQVDDAVAAAHSRMATDAWEGFLSGSAESEPALAGALAADLSGFGDVRDLYQQSGNYISGDAVDTTTVALAAVGITLTVATVFSLGATLPEKAGVSTVKIVNRAGRLSKPLRRQVITLAREAVDTDALKTRRPVAALLRPRRHACGRAPHRAAGACRQAQATRRRRRDARRKRRLSRHARCAGQGPRRNGDQPDGAAFQKFRQGDARRAIFARRRGTDAGLGGGRDILVVGGRRVLDHRRDLAGDPAGGLAAADVVWRVVVDRPAMAGDGEDARTIGARLARR